jgi:hypothetical protein
VLSAQALDVPDDRVASEPAVPLEPLPAHLDQPQIVPANRVAVPAPSQPRAPPPDEE